MLLCCMRDTCGFHYSWFIQYTDELSLSLAKQSVIPQSFTSSLENTGTHLWTMQKRNKMNALHNLEQYLLIQFLNTWLTYSGNGLRHPSFICLSTHLILFSHAMVTTGTRSHSIYTDHIARAGNWNNENDIHYADYRFQKHS